ncbi:MAG: DUF86 domain-containing protein [Bacteroidales bacterium]|nr:DUF86 domain-containing protein [Bacteroidales bacterium]
MELKSSHNELAVNILKQIEKAIEKIQERTKDINHVNDFITSSFGMEKLDATCMLLIAIGESIKGFDKVTNKQILSKDKSIPWNDIMGVRDIIAHHYFDIDAEEIFNIIKYDLEPLLYAIRELIIKIS